MQAQQIRNDKRWLFSPWQTHQFPASRRHSEEQPFQLKRAVSDGAGTCQLVGLHLSCALKAQRHWKEIELSSDAFLTSPPNPPRSLFSFWEVSLVFLIYQPHQNTSLLHHWCKPTLPEGSLTAILLFYFIFFSRKYYRENINATWNNKVWIAEVPPISYFHDGHRKITSPFISLKICPFSSCSLQSKGTLLSYHHLCFPSYHDKQVSLFFILLLSFYSA